jgi:RHS repeat-associated protein
MTNRSRESARRDGTLAAAAVLGLLACVVSLPAATAAQMKTTVTRYSYNADGALTAVTKDVGGSSEATTYLTWDDFTPDAADATNGTTTVGNGRLAAIGPAPGVANAAARFQFDARDRLLSYSGDAATETYDYHADRALASSTVNGDSLDFYQDGATNARITNIHDEGAGLWDAYVGGGRYLSDGREQILLNPRKDMACTYDPSGQTLQSYVYDAFGSQPKAQTQSSYDLGQNPFQYAGEYRDPVWGGVYLRARWYDPDLPLFISRDPMPYLNRYAYAGGNPAMNVDRDGMGFFHSLGHDFKVANAVLNAGVGGHFARIFLAPLMGPLQILANPKGFWQQIKTDKDGIDIFLAAGVATEFATMGLEGYGLSSWVRNLSNTERFLGKLGVAATLGVTQSVTVGADRGFHHFNWEGFGQSLEMSTGSITYDRVLGKGVHPYTLKGEDIAARVAKLQDSNTFLIFREKTQGWNPLAYTSPLQEWRNLGMYHERLVAVSRDFVVINELRRAGPDREFGYVKGARYYPEENQSVGDMMKGRTGRFQFVGTSTDFDPLDFEKSNPRGLLTFRQFNQRTLKNDWKDVPETARYHLFWNNCQDHAAAVLKGLAIQ